MNKFYKVIWSKVKNCYVVVSELAKRHSKNPGSFKACVVSSAFVVSLLCSSFYAKPVYADFEEGTILLAGQCIQVSGDNASQQLSTLSGVVNGIISSGITVSSLDWGTLAGVSGGKFLDTDLSNISATGEGVITSIIAPQVTAAETAATNATNAQTAAETAQGAAEGSASQALASAGGAHLILQLQPEMQRIRQ